MNMKKRVTLTFDPGISHQAKIHARKQGVSVSGLIEQLLRQTLQQHVSPAEVDTHASRWRGAFSMNSDDSPRMEALCAKFDL